MSNIFLFLVALIATRGATVSLFNACLGAVVE